MTITKKRAASRFFGASNNSTDTNSSSSDDDDDEVEIVLVVKPKPRKPREPLSNDSTSTSTARKTGSTDQCVAPSDGGEERGPEEIHKVHHTYINGEQKKSLQEDVGVDVTNAVQGQNSVERNRVKDVQVYKDKEEKATTEVHGQINIEYIIEREEQLNEDGGGKTKTSVQGQTNTESKDIKEGSHVPESVRGKSQSQTSIAHKNDKEVISVHEAVGGEATYSIPCQTNTGISDVEEEVEVHEHIGGEGTNSVQGQAKGGNSYIGEEVQEADKIIVQNAPQESMKDVSVVEEVTNEFDKENKVDMGNSMEKDEPKAKVNPFAQFAFGSSAPSTIANASFRKDVTSSRSRNWIASKKDTPPKKKSKTDKKKKTEWIPLAKLPVEEQQRVLKKWQGLSFDSFSLEDRRFQVMVASRLHARCQESVVRKCMTLLHEAGVLTCTAMAEVDPEVLASLLSSLQYYNTKSRHLVQSSKQLLQDFGGVVPESVDDLRKLIGIGPVMADLLSSINTRDSYRQAE